MRFVIQVIYALLREPFVPLVRFVLKEVSNYLISRMYVIYYSTKLNYLYEKVFVRKALLLSQNARKGIKAVIQANLQLLLANHVKVVHTVNIQELLQEMYVQCTIIARLEQQIF